MSVGPQLSGSALAFGLLVLRDFAVYIKHKRNRIIDLLDDFVKLKNEVDDLRASWKGVNDYIERQSPFIEKTERYDVMEAKVVTMENKYEKIRQQYEVLCTDLESRVRAASGLNPGTEKQRPQDAVCENQTMENTAAIGNQRSQKVQNQNQNNMKGAANEKKNGLGEQKIWTRKFFKLARLDKDICKLTPEVPKLRTELKPEDLTRPAKPKVVEIMPAEKLGNVVPSHQKHLEDLLQYVQKEKYKRIGIYGAPGVGKTNILKNLNNWFDQSSTAKCNFNFCIWVAVQKEDKQEKLIETIQEQIIERLNITAGKNITRNREIISSVLSKKKYLLILDDFSPVFKIEDVGILKEHKNGKVVMAAKDLSELMHAGMDKTIEIPPLSLRKAQIFFKNFIDGYEELSPQHKDMVYPILRQLGGLPEFIVLTARYLNVHRQLLDWKGIKEQLQSGVRVPRLLGMAGVIESYKMAYEDLGENYLKKCLLYTALFPSRNKICRNTLVECWKAEDFLECRSATLHEARAAGTLVLNRLKSSCLLESCGEKCVKMSVFFRKVAFDIPFPEEGDEALCVRSGPEIDGHLEKREWKNARRVSMIGDGLKSVPASPKCGNISTLFLQLNPDLKLIQDAFFTNMKSLRVLDLHGTGITSLPLSISNLAVLRSLYLNDCGSLNRLPAVITELKELEVLDIRGTSIPCLPDEILKLVSLRCLRISFAIKNNNLAAGSKGWKVFGGVVRYLQKISPGGSWVIFPPDAHKKLPNLEEMIIDLREEVSDKVRDIIRREAEEFKIRKNFEFILGPYPGESSASCSQESEDEAEEASNVGERPAGSSLSTAELLGTNKKEISSDSQGTTSQSDFHGRNAFLGSGHLGRPSVTSTQEDKGKGVVKPPSQREEAAELQVQNSVAERVKTANTDQVQNHQGVAKNREPSKTNDGQNESADNQPQRAMQSADHRLSRSGGESRWWSILTRSRSL